MGRERQEAAAEPAAVPGQRADSALLPGAERDDAEQTAGAAAPPAQETRTGQDTATEPDAPPASGTEPTPGTEPTSATPTTPGTPSAPGTPPTPGGPLPHHRIHRTRLSGTWVAIFLFAVVLLLVLIFILQNSHTVEVSYFGAHGHLPLGVALLLAAVGGVLLVALAGSARMMQLRGTARKHRRADVKATQARQA